MGTWRTMASCSEVRMLGECRSRSYWFIRALAENSSIPTNMPNCFCEYPALILAAFSRVPSIHTTPVPLARSLKVGQIWTRWKLRNP